MGCFLDLLSTFLPWGTQFNLQLFLPFSTPLPLGWSGRFLYGDPSVLTISVAVRLAAILGLAALLLYGRYGSVLPTIVMLVSVGLSTGCFAVFSQLGFSLSSGAYVVLLGGLLKIGGLVLRNLYAEITEGVLGAEAHHD